MPSRVQGSTSVLAAALVAGGCATMSLQSPEQTLSAKDADIALEVSLDNGGVPTRFLNPRRPVALFDKLPAGDVVLDQGRAAQGLSPVAREAVEQLRRSLPLVVDDPPEAEEQKAQEQKARNEAVLAVAETALDAIERIRGSATPMGTAPTIAEIAASARSALAGPASAAISAIERIALTAIARLAGDPIYLVRPLRQIATEAIRALLVRSPLKSFDASELIAGTAKKAEDGATALQAISEDASLGEATRQALAEVSAGTTSLVIQQVVREKIDLQQAELKRHLVRFRNETVDRQFVVTFLLRLDGCSTTATPEQQAELREAEQRYGIALRPDGKGNCVATFSLGPGSGGHRDLDAWLVSKAPRTVLRFEVDFFDQTDDPTNTTGFISLTQIDPNAAEFQPESQFAVNVVASVAAALEPALGEGPTVAEGGGCEGGKLRPICPYVDDRKRHEPAIGQVDVSQDLGNRANAKLTLTYKKGDLGAPEDDKANRVTASQYQLNVFATNGVTFTYGKFAFAEPSNRIAIFESGEGLRASLGPVSLAYVLKRESALGTANDDDDDQDAVIFQAIRPLNGNTPLRKLALTYARGEERAAKDAMGKQIGPYTYQTLGGEAFFTVPLGTAVPQGGGPKVSRTPLVGSLAGYYSDRDSDASDPSLLLDARGYVGLLKVSRPFSWEVDPTSKEKLRPRRAFTMFAGYGSGDDSRTRTDESYSGEKAAFAPDALFLAALAPAIVTASDGSEGKVQGGLRGKTYAALQYTDSTASLLAWIAESLLQNQVADIVARSTTVTLHRYWFTEPVFGGTDGGLELDVEFRSESPKGVKWTLVGGYFMPGDALDSVIRKDVWSLSLAMRVEPVKLIF